MQIVERNVTIGGEILIIGEGAEDAEYNSKYILIQKKKHKRSYIDAKDGREIKLRRIFWQFIQVYPALIITLKKPSKKLDPSSHRPYLEIRMLRVDLEYDFAWEFLPATDVSSNFEENQEIMIFPEQ
jgi:hypothetical protein